MTKGQHYWATTCYQYNMTHRYGPATQVRWLQDPKPATTGGATSTPTMAATTPAGNNSATKRPAPATPTAT